eukprot:TRINITY_DN35091_c0_g1_i1.p1 TRINITY_DN35091_c0_g1~~TRINITY_DN35091_c0_g1_i1.p1  ORF type:complete len:173 (+),score=28.05 TRINITY_DN35091_c0_g1_i1:70-588(+)
MTAGGVLRVARIIFILWTAFPPIAIMFWGMKDPMKMVDFQGQAFRPTKENNMVLPLVPDAPFIVEHQDSSKWGIEHQQCVFQYGEFYGSFWLGMVAMMVLVPGAETVRAVCIVCGLYEAVLSNVIWYKQAQFVEGNLSFVTADAIQGLIFLAFACVPKGDAQARMGSEPLLG